MSTLGTLGHVLLVCAIILSLSRASKYPSIVRWTLLGVSAAVGFIKFGELRLIAYSAGVLGDLSITTQTLLAFLILRQAFRIQVFSDRDCSFVLYSAAVGGIALYVFSSGLTIWDLYSLGFDSIVLFIGLAALAVVGWSLQSRAAILIPLGLIAFNFKLLPSTNVWDYLLDPVVVLFAWVWLVAMIAGRALFRSTAEATR